YRCMYNWLFSRSEGAGSATTRKTRGLTRSVIALMVPPFPAASRPSKMTMTRSPFALTHSWRMQSFACSLCSCFSNFRCLSFDIAADASALKDRLEQPRRQRPHRSVAAEEFREIAADAAEKPGEADGRKEQRLRRADIGIRRDQQLFRLEDVRPPLEERSG